MSLEQWQRWINRKLERICRLEVRFQRIDIRKKTPQDELSLAEFFVLIVIKYSELRLNRELRSFKREPQSFRGLFSVVL